MRWCVQGKQFLCTEMELVYRTLPPGGLQEALMLFTRHNQCIRQEFRNLAGRPAFVSFDLFDGLLRTAHPLGQVTPSQAQNLVVVAEPNVQRSKSLPFASQKVPVIVP